MNRLCTSYLRQTRRRTQRTPEIRILPTRLKAARGRWMLAALLLVCGLKPCFGSAALLMEEPFGDFGAFNPTGHAAVYLDHVCADTPTHLRACQPGEHGVVISRYHKVNGLDWAAIPLVPYLYAVDSMADVPDSVTPAEVNGLRAAYWREHLQALAPGKADVTPPGGEWIQLVGSSYDRKIHGFQVVTTAEQDERFIALYNDRRNVGHFNLFFHNCADFSRVVMNEYFPGAIHRNYVADLGMMTPKQAARSMLSYGAKHPELKMDVFVIEQVPGTLPRSHHTDGVSESLVRSKKYMVPLIVLTPHIAAGAVVTYVTNGHLRLPKDARVFHIEDAQSGEEAAVQQSPAVVDEAPATEATSTPVAETSKPVEEDAPVSLPVVAPGRDASASDETEHVVPAAL